MEKIVKPIVWPSSLLTMIFCRKSGNVYAGASPIAILDCWIVAGGSAMLCSSFCRLSLRILVLGLFLQGQKA